MKASFASSGTLKACKVLPIKLWQSALKKKGNIQREGEKKRMSERGGHEGNEREREREREREKMREKERENERERKRETGARRE